MITFVDFDNKNIHGRWCGFGNVEIVEGVDSLRFPIHLLNS